MLPAVAKAETFSDSPVIVEPAIPEVYKSLDAKWQSFVKACVDLRPCVDTALEHARKAGPGSAKKIDPNRQFERTSDDDAYDALKRQAGVFHCHLDSGDILAVLSSPKHPDYAEAKVAAEKGLYLVELQLPNLRSEIGRLYIEKQRVFPQIEKYQKYTALRRAVAEPEKQTTSERASNYGFVQAVLAEVARAQADWLASPEARVANNAFIAYQNLLSGNAGEAVEILTCEANLLEQRALRGKAPTPKVIGISKGTRIPQDEVAKKLGGALDAEGICRAGELLVQVQTRCANDYTEKNGWNPQEILSRQQGLTEIIGAFNAGVTSDNTTRESATRALDSILETSELKSAIQVAARFSNAQMELNHLQSISTNVRNLMSGKY